MKRVLFLAAMIIACMPATAQVTVYRTFADYENGTGEEYDEYVTYFHAGGKVKLTFKGGGKKTAINCGDMWGFKYKDALFRIDERYEQPTRVMSMGKMIYYENGMAHLQIMRDGTDEGFYSIGYREYVSAGLNSEMFQLSEGISDGKSKLRKFKEGHPEYATFFDCWDNGKTVTRQCVEKLEGE